MKNRAAFFASVVIVAAVAVLAYSFRDFAALVRIDPQGIVTWFALLAIAGVFTYVALRGGGAVTGTAVVNFAVVITYGGQVACWLAAVEMLLLTLLLLRFDLLRSLFNASQMAVSLALAGAVYAASGGPILAAFPDLGVRSIAPLVLCYLTYYFSNTGLVAVWIGLRQKRSAAAAWKASYLWTLPQSFAVPVVGVGLAYLFVRASLWLVAVFFLWLVYYARTSKTNLELGNSQRETVAALASMVDSTTPFLSGESERVAGLALELGKRLGVAGWRLRALECAALLHDVGYISVGSRILSKGSALAPDEWGAVVKHAETGASIVGKIGGLQEASEIVLAHHERPDGRGYPRGLKEGEIPQSSSILKVADAFVAMTTERPYRTAMPALEAVERIRARSGSQFDSGVVQALVNSLRAGGLNQFAMSQFATADMAGQATADVAKAA